MISVLQINSELFLFILLPCQYLGPGHSFILLSRGIGIDCRASLSIVDMMSSNGTSSRRILITSYTEVWLSNKYNDFRFSDMSVVLLSDALCLTVKFLILFYKLYTSNSNKWIPAHFKMQGISTIWWWCDMIFQCKVSYLIVFNAFWFSQLHSVRNCWLLGVQRTTFIYTESWHQVGGICIQTCDFIISCFATDKRAN